MMFVAGVKEAALCRAAPCFYAATPIFTLLRYFAATPRRHADTQALFRFLFSLTSQLITRRHFTFFPADIRYACLPLPRRHAR